MGLTVVIPSYNSARWLPETLKALKASLRQSTWDAEIIIVDDGSTDETAKVLEKLSLDRTIDIRVISQPNEGRFLARWAGISLAKNEKILLLDSRVIIGEDSLRFVQERINNSSEDLVWNAFVETDEKSSLPGFFWDIPTRLFWGKFLANPQPVRFGTDGFDSYPKGTGCLLVGTDLLRRSYLSVWPEGDKMLVSDDTRLLREIVRQRDIVLDPSFHATYRPRVDFASFMSHTFNRGTLFVDSYAGTSLMRKVFILFGSLIPFAAISLTLTGNFVWVALTGILFLLIPALIGALRRATRKSIASYLFLVVPFGFLFWAGVVRGVWVHRRHFACRERGSK